jgi:phosphate-selective porin OprO/OprP
MRVHHFSSLIFASALGLHPSAVAAQETPTTGGAATPDITPPPPDRSAEPPPATPAPEAISAKPETKKDRTLETTSPKDGFGLVSPDGDFSLKIRGVVQADARSFFQGGVNTFLIRRARPTLEGAVYRYFEYRMTAELVSSPSVLDVWANVRLAKEIQLRAGKFKSPLGLERLQNDPDLPLMERGLPTDLVPDRDVGVILHGDIADGAISYAAGIFDGAEDNKSIDTDTSDKKDVVGRIFLRPLVPLKIDALKNLGFGVAASRGTHTEALPTYVTPSQITFFQYSGAALAVGTHRRIAPQAYFYVGPVGLLGEYTRSSQIVATSNATKLVSHQGWQLEISAFVTGEHASFGAVSPQAPLDPHKGSIGAIELAARIGALTIDDAVFDLSFADPNKSARSAKEWAVGLNWHLARGFKLALNYEHVAFQGGAAKSTDRPAESALLTRLQAAF